MANAEDFDIPEFVPPLALGAGIGALAGFGGRRGQNVLGGVNNAANLFLGFQQNSQRQQQIEELRKHRQAQLEAQRQQMEALAAKRRALAVGNKALATGQPLSSLPEDVLGHLSPSEALAFTQFNQGTISTDPLLLRGENFQNIEPVQNLGPDQSSSTLAGPALNINAAQNPDTTFLPQENDVVGRPMLALGGGQQPITEQAYQALRGKRFTPEGLKTALETMGISRPQAVKLTDIATMRDDFTKQSNTFMEASRNFGIIESVSSQPASPMGDLFLVFATMKVLDPTSVVRESEQGLVIESRSLAEGTKTFFQRVLNGQKLTPDQRADILNTSRTAFTGQLEAQSRVESQFTDLARRNNIRPEDVLVGGLTARQKALLQDHSDGGPSRITAPQNGTPTINPTSGKPHFERYKSGELTPLQATNQYLQALKDAGEDQEKINVLINEFTKILSADRANNGTQQ